PSWPRLRRKQCAWAADRSSGACTPRTRAPSSSTRAWAPSAGKPRSWVSRARVCGPGGSLARLHLPDLDVVDELSALHRRRDHGESGRVVGDRDGVEVLRARPGDARGLSREIEEAHAAPIAGGREQSTILREP